VARLIEALGLLDVMLRDTDTPHGPGKSKDSAHWNLFANVSI
jgi:hypothetical protein